MTKISESTGKALLYSLITAFVTLFIGFLLGKGEVEGRVVEGLDNVKKQVNSIQAGDIELDKRITFVENDEGKLSVQTQNLTKAVEDLTTEIRQTRNLSTTQTKRRNSQ
jgi:nitrogen fixation/metabolism regulation signal transduction histidine kinase